MSDRPEDRTLPPDETQEQTEAAPVTHGGEGDPLGEGVADQDDNPRVTDGDGGSSEIGEPRPPA